MWVKVETFRELQNVGTSSIYVRYTDRDGSETVQRWYGTGLEDGTPVVRLASGQYITPAAFELGKVEVMA